MTFNLVKDNINEFAQKYLYISDTQIKGHVNNNKSGTANSGVKYNSSWWVLRAVIGV